MRFLTFLSVLLFSTLAHANVGIPVVSFGLPFMILNLALVVLIETFVIKKRGHDAKVTSLMRGVLIANLFTTFIGYPVVAILEASSALVGMHLGWLLPFENLSQMHGYVSTMMFLTLIPSFFLSVWIEGAWLKRYQIPMKSVWLAHLFSYLFLTAQVYLFPPTLLFKLGEFVIEPSYIVVMKILEMVNGQ